MAAGSNPTERRGAAASVADNMRESPLSDTTVYSASNAVGVNAVLIDLVKGWRMDEVWRAFAWDEIQNRYRRSIFGVAWIFLSFIIFVGGIAIFFGGFSSKDGVAFMAFVALGFSLFQFIISIITDGCNVFRLSATWIKSSTLPYSIYVYMSVSRSLFPFLIHIVTTIGGMAVFGQLELRWEALAAIPALAIIMLNAVPAQMLLGTIAARYRDITHLVTSITRILFFATPVLWVLEEQSGFRAKLAEMNPLTHYIEIFRAPLLGGEARALSWYVVIGCTLFLWITAIAVMAQLRRRLPFWV